MKLAQVSLLALWTAHAAPEDDEQIAAIPVIDSADTTPELVLDDELDTTTPEPYLASTSTDEFELIEELTSTGGFFTDFDLMGTGLNGGDEFSDDNEESGTLPAFVMGPDSTTLPVVESTTLMQPIFPPMVTTAVTEEAAAQTMAEIQTQDVPISFTKAFQSADVESTIAIALPLAAGAMFFI